MPLKVNCYELTIPWENALSPFAYMREQGAQSSMAELSLDGIDPEELLLRLVHHACALYQCSPDADLALRGDGSGPQDLAMTVITRFLDPDDKTVHWGQGRGQPTLRGLLSYLKHVLANDFVDMKRSKRYKTTVFASPLSRDADAGETGISLEDFSAHIESPEGRAIWEAQRTRLLQSFQDEPDLEELLIVQLDPQGYQAFTNQDLSALLDIPISDVVNRKKKLSRRLMRILAEQKAAGK